MRSPVRSPLTWVMAGLLLSSPASQEMERTTVKKHGSQKRQDLLGEGEVHGDLGVGITDRDDTVNEEKLLQIRLEKLPQASHNVHTNQAIPDDGVVF